MKPTLYSLYSFCIGFLSSRATALQNMVSRGRNGAKECCHIYAHECATFHKSTAKEAVPPSPVHSQYTTSTQLTRIKWNGSGETFRNRFGMSSFSGFYPLIRQGQPPCQLMRPNFFCVFSMKSCNTPTIVYILSYWQRICDSASVQHGDIQIFSASSTVPHLPCIAVNPRSYSFSTFLSCLLTAKAMSC